MPSGKRNIIFPERKKGLYLNMTPMIDVVFQLIIFFMTVAEFARLETEDVNLPVADQSRVEEVVPVGRLVVNVKKDGTIVVSKMHLDLKTFGTLLKGEVLKHRTKSGEIKLEVHVRADRETEYGRIQDIMLVCAKNGIWQLSFAALPEEEPGRRGAALPMGKGSGPPIRIAAVGGEK